MTCNQCRRILSEGARTGSSSQGEHNTRTHLQQCSNCRQFLQTMSLVQSGLDDLAAVSSPAGRMEALKARVMLKFDQANNAPGRSKSRSHRIWVLTGLEVTLASAILVFVWVSPTANHRPDVVQVPVERGNENPFIPVPYVVPPAPFEQTYVVRTDVALAELSAAGFQVHVPEAEGFVAADVMRGQDGRLLAVRFVDEPNK